MKKIFIIIVLLIIFNNTYSQFIKEINQFSGVSYSSIEWKYKTMNVEFMERPSIGAAVKVDIKYYDSKYWDINSNISYIQRKCSDSITLTTVEEPEGIGKLKSNFEYNYLTLNAAIRAKYKTKIITPYILIGPRFDYMVSGTDINKKFNKKYNYGFDAGVGIEKEIKDKFVIKLQGIYNKCYNYIVTNDFVDVSVKYFYLIELGLGVKIRK